jgi:hypothetical protein
MLGRCGVCHVSQPDANAYAKGSADTHGTVYYPKAKLTLAEKQTVKFGSYVVSQSGGRLYLRDSAGRKFELPAGAMIVKGRDGKPAFLVYEGIAAPTLVR